MPVINGLTVERVIEYTDILAEDTRTKQKVGTIDCIVMYGDRAETVGDVYGKGRVEMVFMRDAIYVGWQGREYTCDALVNLLSRTEIVEWSAAVLVAINEGKLRPHFRA
jgi:hypothetical protein